MKANQKFMKADDAVSPVIGVILMVAITVVLAAVVFVLVSDLGDTGDAAPNVSFQRDEADDELSVVSADSGANWNEFAIRASQGVTYDLNGDTAAVSGGATTFVDAGSVSGGDTISFCGTGGDLEDVTITISHIESNSQVASFDFTTIAGC